MPPNTSVQMPEITSVHLPKIPSEVPESTSVHMQENTSVKASAKSTVPMNPQEHPLNIQLLDEAEQLEVIVEDLPHTTFTISVKSRVLDGHNKLQYLAVSITGGKVPAWISVHDGLQVFIGDVAY